MKRSKHKSHVIYYNIYSIIKLAVTIWTELYILLLYMKLKYLFL